MTSIRVKGGVDVPSPPAHAPAKTNPRAGKVRSSALYFQTALEEGLTKYGYANEMVSIPTVERAHFLSNFFGEIIPHLGVYTPVMSLLREKLMECIFEKRPSSVEKWPFFKQIQTYQQELMDQTVSTDKYVQKIGQSDAINQTLRREHQLMSDQVAKLTADLKSQRDETEGMRIGFERLQSEVASLEKTIQAKNDELRFLSEFDEDEWEEKVRKRKRIIEKMLMENEEHDQSDERFAHWHYLTMDNALLNQNASNVLKHLGDFLGDMGDQVNEVIVELDEVHKETEIKKSRNRAPEDVERDPDDLADPSLVNQLFLRMSDGRGKMTDIIKHFMDLSAASIYEACQEVIRQTAPNWTQDKVKQLAATFTDSRGAIEKVKLELQEELRGLMEKQKAKASVDPSVAQQIKQVKESISQLQAKDEALRKYYAKVISMQSIMPSDNSASQQRARGKQWIQMEKSIEAWESAVAIIRHDDRDQIYADLKVEIDQHRKIFNKKTFEYAENITSLCVEGKKALDDLIELKQQLSSITERIMDVEMSPNPTEAQKMKAKHSENMLEQVQKRYDKRLNDWKTAMSKLSTDYNTILQQKYKLERDIQEAERGTQQMRNLLSKTINSRLKGTIGNLRGDMRRLKEEVEKMKTGWGPLQDMFTKNFTRKANWFRQKITAECNMELRKMTLEKADEVPIEEEGVDALLEKLKSSEAPQGRLPSAYVQFSDFDLKQMGNEELRKEVQELQDNLKKESDQVNRLQHQVHTLSDLLAHYRDATDDLSKNTDMLHGALEQEKTFAHEDISQMQREIEKLQNMVLEHANRYDLLDSKTKAIEEDKAELKSHLTEAQAKATMFLEIAKEKCVRYEKLHETFNLELAKNPGFRFHHHSFRDSMDAHLELAEGRGLHLTDEERELLGHLRNDDKKILEEKWESVYEDEVEIYQQILHVRGRVEKELKELSQQFQAMRRTKALVLQKFYSDYRQFAYLLDAVTGATTKTEAVAEKNEQLASERSPTSTPKSPGSNGRVRDLKDKWRAEVEVRTKFENEAMVLKQVLDRKEKYAFFKEIWSVFEQNRGSDFKTRRCGLFVPYMKDVHDPTTQLSARVALGRARPRGGALIPALLENEMTPVESVTMARRVINKGEFGEPVKLPRQTSEAMDELEKFIDEDYEHDPALKEKFEGFKKSIFEHGLGNVATRAGDAGVQINPSEGEGGAEVPEGGKKKEGEQEGNDTGDNNDSQAEATGDAVEVDSGEKPGQTESNEAEETGEKTQEEGERAQSRTRGTESSGDGEGSQEEKEKGDEDEDEDEDEEDGKEGAESDGYTSDEPLNEEATKIWHQVKESQKQRDKEVGCSVVIHDSHSDLAMGVHVIPSPTDPKEDSDHVRDLLIHLYREEAVLKKTQARNNWFMFVKRQKSEVLERRFTSMVDDPWNTDYHDKQSVNRATTRLGSKWEAVRQGWVYRREVLHTLRRKILEDTLNSILEFMDDKTDGDDQVALELLQKTQETVRQKALAPAQVGAMPSTMSLPSLKLDKKKKKMRSKRKKLERTGSSKPAASIDVEVPQFPPQRKGSSDTQEASGATAGGTGGDAAVTGSGA